MTLFVVGTGRSGTYSIATAFEQMGYDASHERWAWATTQAAYWYTTKRLSLEEARLLVSQTEWSQVEVDSKLSELVPVLADTFPDAKFLWTRRDPDKVAKSMVKHGWYRSQDDFTPDLYYAGFRENQGRVSLYVNLNQAGHRTKAWEVSDVSVWEWRNATQHTRCQWFVSWITHLLETTLPADRSKTIDIETVTPDDLYDIARWAFPDQIPTRLSEVPNVRIEDPTVQVAVEPRPRENTIRGTT